MARQKKPGRYGKPLSAVYHQKHESAMGSMESAMTGTMYEIQKAFPTVVTPYKRCIKCDKEIPFWNVLMGRRNRSKYCSEKCRSMHYKDSRRTKPKVWRGKRRLGL